LNLNSRNAFFASLQFGGLLIEYSTQRIERKNKFAS
jgi:hypothetical protein